MPSRQTHPLVLGERNGLTPFPLWWLALLSIHPATPRLYLCFFGSYSIFSAKGVPFSRVVFVLIGGIG